MAEMDEDLVESIRQKNADQRASMVTEDPTDPLRGTVRGLFGNLTGDRQASVSAARAALEAEQARKLQAQSMRDELMARNLEEKRLERLPNIDISLSDGSKMNLRELARYNPQMAQDWAQSEMERKAQIMKADREVNNAKLAKAMADIEKSRTAIATEQQKQAGLFGLGGPNKGRIEEEQQKITNLSQEYGIPLGSEPEEATPQPAAQAGAASSWLRSKLK